MKNNKGFTLIELLVVIAVLGVLAAVILVAINPLEQLARGRDSGRKSTAGQLASAVQAYYTSHNGVYPKADNKWITTLKEAGEIKSEPGEITYSTGTITGCSATTAQNKYCYALNGDEDEAVVYVQMESQSERSKCPTSGTTAYFAWSSTDSKAGVVCTAGEPTAVELKDFQP